MATRKVKFDFTPSKYQEKFFDFVQHGVGNAVIEAAAGSGKCLGFDTEILMYDGSIKKVQDIKVGDLLMGDDSQPRKVLSTNVGEGRLKRIVPKKGNSWVCNDVHILTLDKDILDSIRERIITDRFIKTESELILQSIFPIFDESFLEQQINNSICVLEKMIHICKH